MRIRLRLVLLLMVILLGTVPAAEADVPLLRIVREGDLFQDPDLNRMVDYIRRRLQLREVRLRDRDELDQNDATLYFTRAGDGEVWVELRNAALSAVSPALMADQALLLPLDAVDEDPIMELLMGIGLVAVGVCDEAHEDLTYAMANVDDRDLIALSAFYDGNCHLVMADLDRAQGAYEIAIDNASQPLVPAYNNLAWIMLQRGESGTAIDIVTSVLDWATGRDDAAAQIRILAHRAWLYALAFDYTAAIADVDAAIALASLEAQALFTEAELYNLRGQMVMLTYEWNVALADYNRALELAPDYAEAYYNRGVLLYTMAQRLEALDDFQRYLELSADGDQVQSAREYIDNIYAELSALD